MIFIGEFGINVLKLSYTHPLLSVYFSIMIDICQSLFYYEE